MDPYGRFIHITCDAGAVDLNGYTLTVGGEVYNGGACSGTMADI